MEVALAASLEQEGGLPADILPIPGQEMSHKVIENLPSALYYNFKNNPTFYIVPCSI